MILRTFKSLLFLLAFFVFQANSSNGLAGPNPHSLPNLFVNQVSHGGGVPNGNAAFFKYFNPDADPVATRINLGAAFSGVPVELDPGEAAIASQGWFMFFIDHCEDQVVREVVDFESPQCQVSDPFETDPNISLSELANLPEECLASPSDDPCAVFEGPLRYDFGTSQAQTRKLLKNEITQAFELDGAPVPPDLVRIKQLEYTLNAGDPEDSLNCSDQLFFSSLNAYFFYGYQIPAVQSGGCMTKISAAVLTPLTQGDHEFMFHASIGGEPQDFPPVTIIQY